MLLPQLLSSKLSDVEILQILVTKGLSVEQAEAALSTATLSAAENGATHSTLVLTAAVKGFGVKLKELSTRSRNQKTNQVNPT